MILKSDRLEHRLNAFHSSGSSTSVDVPAVCRVRLGQVLMEPEAAVWIMVHLSMEVRTCAYIIIQY